MKTLSFVSLALFISHLMPVLAVKSQICDGVTIPKSTIIQEIKDASEKQPILKGKLYLMDDTRGQAVFMYTPPIREGSPLRVSITFNMRGEIKTISATRNGVVFSCVEKRGGL